MPSTRLPINVFIACSKFSSTCAVLKTDVSNIGHRGNGDFEITLTIDSDLDYVFQLIQQSFDVNADFD